MAKNPEDMVEKYLQKILECNKSINLTRITDDKEARLLHIEDSLTVLDDLNSAPEGLYGDLGSGGGFPGVPLAIYSGRKTILIDSVKKKMKAVQNILNELQLQDQISTCDKRIEEVAIDNEGSFSVLTARALSSLPSLLELAAPLLKLNGRLICLKAQVGEEELTSVKAIANKVGMRPYSEREMYLNDGETYRRIFVFEKFKDPEIPLPRRVGLAQKRPLKNQ